MGAFWEILHAAGADVVLSGHDHIYQRFEPQDGTGAINQDQGIRSFVVGTDGKDLYEFDNPHPSSAVRENQTFGVLKLTLHPDSYDWAFIPIQGLAFEDKGHGSCH